MNECGLLCSFLFFSYIQEVASITLQLMVFFISSMLCLNIFHLSNCIFKFLHQEKDVENIKQSLIDGYENSFWSCSVSKLGYSGTAIISRVWLFFSKKRLSMSCPQKFKSIVDICNICSFCLSGK